MLGNISFVKTEAKNLINRSINMVRSSKGTPTVHNFFKKDKKFGLSRKKLGFKILYR
jgi:hypothetical protein